jgi:hypothetical protein
MVPTSAQYFNTHLEGEDCCTWLLCIRQTESVTYLTFNDGVIKFPIAAWSTTEEPYNILLHCVNSSIYNDT